MWLLRLLAILAVPLQMIEQQQTIKSTGDHNVNVNSKSPVTVIVFGDPNTASALHKEAKSTLGNANLWQGLLIPSNEKVDSLCEKMRASLPSAFADMTPKMPKVLFSVMAGGNEFECTSLPCNIVRTDEHELLAVDGKVGALTVEAKVLDENGDIITSIEKGKFYVNPNRTYRSPERNNKSSLKVFDMKGNAALEVRYANRNTLIIEGLFRTALGQLMEVTPNEIRTTSVSKGYTSPQRTSGNCYVQFDDSGHAGYFAVQTGEFFFGGSPK